MKYTRFFLPFSAAFLLILSACSCSTEGNIQRILGQSAEAPVFLDCRSVSPTELLFSFSRPVRVVSLSFDSGLEAGSVEEGREVKINFPRPLEAGRKITADILVEDKDRNSLNVIVPFRARNDRMPVLVFNELRTEYSKPRAEFVEFFVSEAGNLGALRLFIGAYSLEKAVYEFPPAEVKAGEYVVLHLRGAEGCADETGENLALSGGYEAEDNARDFWVPGNTKLLHKTDILWIADQDGGILDALPLSDKAEGPWEKKGNAAAAEFLGRNKAWLPPAVDDSGAEGDFIPAPPDAVISGGTTATRTVCRDEKVPPERRTGNWYVTANSGSTPGKPNNPKRYR